MGQRCVRIASRKRSRLRLRVATASEQTTWNQKRCVSTVTPQNKAGWFPNVLIVSDHRQLNLLRLCCLGCLSLSL